MRKPLASFGLPLVIAVNKFITDTEQEVQTLIDLCEQANLPVSLTEVWEKGGAGGVDLANKLLEVIEKGESNYHPLYELTDSIEEKVRTIVQKVYGGKDVEFSSKAKKQLIEFEQFGWGNYPFVWLKHNIPFLMIRQNLAGRRVYD